MSEGDFTTGYYDGNGQWHEYGEQQPLTPAQEAGIAAAASGQGGYNEGDFTSGYWDNGVWRNYGGEQGLTPAQEAGIAAVAAGQQGNPEIGENIPGTPNYNPNQAPTEFKPVNLPDNYNDLPKKEQFDIAKREGLIPKTSVFVPVAAQVMPDDQANFLQTSPVLRQVGWSYISKSEAEAIKATDPELYDTLTTKGYEDYQALAEKKKADWESELKKDSPELYKIYKEQGIGAMQEAVSKINKEYEEWQDKLKSGEIIALPDGKYIEKKQFDKMPIGTQKILVSGGFDELDKVTALSWVYKGKTISGDERTRILQEYDSEKAQLIKDGKMFTKEWYALGADPRDMMSLDKYSSNRVLTETVALVFPPYRALLPEYDVKDIKGSEWALAGINTILLATVILPEVIAASVAGKIIITGTSTAGAGIIGYETAKNWNELSTPQKVMGVGGAVLYSLPLLATVARGVKVGGSEPIPTAKGEVQPWKGLAIADHPIIGRSDGKWVLGSRNITLPEARLISEGYKPEMMLETKVFTNRSALEKAGFSKAQIDYLELTLKDRNLFAGEKSPSLSKEVMLEPTERLTAGDVQVVLKKINQYNKEIKQVDVIYGSTTIKSQLAPELREWRGVHDWDIKTNMDTEGTRAFAESLVKDLQKTGKGKYRMSPDPDHPFLVEKYIDGKWEHIADIHAPGESIPSTDIPKSKLDYTGKYSYGRMVAEPAVTVEYPGIGKFDIMSLSESGVRKSDTILRVRQTETGSAFRPPERGIAEPGVPKDAADFYVILRTFKGEGTAEKWLASWAKAMGYTDKELTTVLPKIRKAMEEVAQGTPSNLVGYRFTPSKSGAVGKNASPTAVVKVPASLAASVSPSLSRSISSPVAVYKGNIIPVSPKIASPGATSPGRAGVKASSVPLSQKISTIYSKTLSPGISSPAAASASPTASVVSKPKASGSPSKAVSPKPGESTSPSPYTSPSPGKSPSPSTGKSPSPGTSPSPDTSPSPGKSPSPDTSPSPDITVTPSPSPEFVPPPPPPPPPTHGKPSARPKPGSAKKEERKDYTGSVAWKQGIGWWVFSPPYNRPGDKTFVLSKPQGAKIAADARTAIGTIQAIGGTAPIDYKFDMGITDVYLKDPPRSPSVEPGRKAIRFKRDKDRTYGGNRTRAGRVGPYYYKDGALSKRPI